MVTEGELVLVQDEGEYVMRPGDCAAFPAGDTNGHHFLNRTDAEARFLVVGDRRRRARSRPTPTSTSCSRWTAAGALHLPRRHALGRAAVMPMIVIAQGHRRRSSPTTRRASASGESGRGAAIPPRGAADAVRRASRHAAARRALLRPALARGARTSSSTCSTARRRWSRSDGRAPAPARRRRLSAGGRGERRTTVLNRSDAPCGFLIVGTRARARTSSTTPTSTARPASTARTGARRRPRRHACCARGGTTDAEDRHPAASPAATW